MEKLGEGFDLTLPLPHPSNVTILATIRAVDPHSFFSDPDPAVFLHADPDPGGKMNADPDPQPCF